MCSLIFGQDQLASTRDFATCRSGYPATYLRQIPLRVRSRGGLGSEARFIGVLGLWGREKVIGLLYRSWLWNRECGDAARKIRRSAGADLSDHGTLCVLGNWASSWGLPHIKCVGGPRIVRGWQTLAKLMEIMDMSIDVLSEI